MNKENNNDLMNSEYKNPFKLINQVNELPPKLKDEVMAAISYLHLASDIGKLFSVDMAKTARKMIDPSSIDKK